MSRFTDDTAVVAQGEGRYGARIDHGWWIQRGPNGGYLAAIVLRAITAEVADPNRRPRSLTLHYLRPPAEGPCEVAVVVERAGRGLSTVSARLQQGGQDCIIALAALGVDRDGASFDDLPAPDVARPGAAMERPPAIVIPMAERYDSRPVIGGMPFEPTSDEALTGGWIRTMDDDRVDAILVAALADAWPPALFTRAAAPVGVPTVDLTIHFRHAPVSDDPWCLVQFRTKVAAEGFIEEDGEVWSADGLLLAQSRQLAVIVAPG
jgi:acyl-CoA thioesterase